ncbi:MAG TPA: cation acetate symporter [Accumulibacter sp.]|nr:sodium:solute symporter family protein [Accumulibacter sp.]HMW19047.1 cation acetate symporter [Accumulibacter sp.]HMX23052.1 cation acetate symporter [Accumulibacter sp.]HMY06548.1 cation acetate symporter [Accumulibacter sp.]HNC19034.1 cation acetate symporter [Accumulibacter sp.]
MADYTVSLRRYYGYYTAIFFLAILALAVLERHGMPARWIGYSFLLLTLVLYATIGVLARTASLSEYYVAGRRVPAVFNGMATGADWMSSASFMGLAGMLYLAGYQGLAYVMGWTGGYVLVALLLAPYLRRFGQFTIPDFLAARYGGNAARLIGVFATVLASFVYVVAQIYGVGLITSRFVGLQFEVGVFVGLAGILVCSFLGGMRAVTWTQVAQYIILIVAYLVPVTILSYQVTGIPLPQVTYGQVLQKVTQLENTIFQNTAEIDVRRIFRERADVHYQRMLMLPGSLQEESHRLTEQIETLKRNNAQMRDVAALERQRHDLPKSSEEARSYWEGLMRQEARRGAEPAHHSTAFPGEKQGLNNTARLNFLTLVFCLMVGTAALPHVLMRYYTTPTVRDARNSVFWSLFFILILYLTAPAYAVFAKYEIYTKLIGTTIADLPSWVTAWGKIGLVSIEDVNGDGILQLAELSLNPDVILLATPEIAGLPYVISGLVAAGALAAALSTADGLLLTIASALSHDVYYKIFRPQATTQGRLVVSKSLLLVVAVLAATVASQQPATILFMVAWAFSLAGAAFFPALILGVFWKRANPAGALSGMLVGLVVTLYYMVRVEFDRIPWLGWHGIGMEPWFGIESTSAGVWGVAAGFLTIIGVSLCTRPPSREIQNFVESVRYPDLVQ